MVIDWFVLLTPLLLLPIAWLLIFVGCFVDRSGLAHCPCTRFLVTFFPESLGSGGASQFHVVVDITFFNSAGLADSLSLNVDRPPDNNPARDGGQFQYRLPTGGGMIELPETASLTERYTIVCQVLPSAGDGGGSAIVGPTPPYELRLGSSEPLRKKVSFVAGVGERAFVSSETTIPEGG
ncbi:MAG: hypothetical protein JW918_19275 [Anaerolineae bacterium]|nr:hypothetical protein [Anaerolineae bacterium]